MKHLLQWILCRQHKAIFRYLYCRLNNFGRGSNVGPEKSEKNFGEIPGPGTVLSAKRQYLDNLEKNKNNLDRDRAGHTQRVSKIILNNIFHFRLFI